jgi:chemotaxis protein MotB
VRYPSNWELSSARAAAVVQLFIEEGVDSSRLVAAGYGEFQPVGPNDTPENRTRNRRVVLMISKTGELRPVLKPVTPGGDQPDQTSVDSSIELQPIAMPSLAPLAIPDSPAPAL